MKKYRVTEKHEFLKANIILYESGAGGVFYTPKSLHVIEPFSEREIDIFLKQGWIEEIKEPEFTKEDMVKFGKWCYTGDQEPLEEYEIALNQWIRKYKNEK